MTAGAAVPTSPPPEPAYPSSWPEFDAMFPDDAACRRYLEVLRWPHGFVCPTCGPAQAYRVRGNSMKCARLACIGLIVAGVVGLRFAGGH